MVRAGNARKNRINPVDSQGMHDIRQSRASSRIAIKHPRINGIRIRARGILCQGINACLYSFRWKIRLSLERKSGLFSVIIVIQEHLKQICPFNI